MKKDKAFAEKGYMTVLLDRSSLYINEKTYKDLRKFIKALKKGLRRLEK